MLDYLICKTSHIYAKVETKKAQYLYLHLPSSTGIKTQVRIWTLYSDKKCQTAVFYFFLFFFLSKPGSFFQVIPCGMFWHHFHMICSFKPPQWTWITKFKSVRSRTIYQHLLYLTILIPVDTWSTLLKVNCKMFTVITAMEQRIFVISSEKTPFLVACLNVSILERKSRLGFYLIHRNSVCCSTYHILPMLSEDVKIS